MRIRSFQGLRPAPESVQRVVSLPYDVVSTGEARALTAGNPLSLLRVVRAEIDFPEGTDPYSDPVYARAVENFNALQHDGHLIRESEPCLYVYQQRMGDHVQRGIVALAHVDDYDQDSIRKHEKTRVDKENDRTRLTDALSANPGPVFLTYRSLPELDQLADEAVRAQPLYDLVADDGIRHTVWRVPGGQAIIEAFRGVPLCYVADGHHRAASAARVARERRAANPKHTGEEDYNWFLTVLFAGDQLKVLPYNRLLHDLNGLSPAQCMERLRAVARVEPAAATPVPGGPGDVRLYLDGAWHALFLAAEPGADPAERLDVSLLQEQILSPIFGIDDPRTSERVSFVGGIRGAAYLQREVDEGRAALAFSLHPVSVDQLMGIADAGQIMPPKSTWFEPKLRSGFLIHTF
jgi:uncharacterized protein (DUF1015 family)